MQGQREVLQTLEGTSDKDKLERLLKSLRKLDVIHDAAKVSSEESGGEDMLKRAIEQVEDLLSRN